MQQQLAQAEYAPLFGMADVYQQQAQRELEAQRQTALERQGEPYQRLGFISDVLAKTPSAYTTVGLSTAPTPSPISQALGLGIAGLSAFGQYKQATKPPTQINLGNYSGLVGGQI